MKQVDKLSQAIADALFELEDKDERDIQKAIDILAKAWEENNQYRLNKTSK
jgi:hypothetical protein